MYCQRRKITREFEFILLTVLLLISSKGAATQAHVSWVLSGQQTQNQPAVWLGIEQREAMKQLNGLVDIELLTESWTSLIAITFDDLYRSDTTETSSDLVIQELYWQHSLDILNNNIEILAGKHRLDWGVGYGYRPLDVFKPYNQNPIGIQVEEGAGVLLLSMFDHNGEWSLLYSDSTWSSQPTSNFEEQLQQQGVGVRRYVFADEIEYQWLAYYDDVRHGLLGASIVTVLSQALEVHAEVAYQRHSLRYQLPDDVYQPVILGESQDAYQGLIGFTWAHEVGGQVIVEYWYDSQSWGKGEWRKARSVQTKRVDSELKSSYMQGLQYINLMHHNLLFHAQFDGKTIAANYPELPGFEYIEMTIDILLSPEDGGVIATESLIIELLDTGDNLLELELIARQFSGDSESLYKNLSEERSALINLKGSF